MHLLVLSAFRHHLHVKAGTDPDGVSMHLLVLSAFRRCHASGSRAWVPSGLNAPSGAQCFPTRFTARRDLTITVSQCTFWCSVLSDDYLLPSLEDRDESQCTFWCSVLSDRNMIHAYLTKSLRSQCTFWCSVLSDVIPQCHELVGIQVSMHLLVLSAFRPGRRRASGTPRGPVSMHLLVLSAFRQEDGCVHPDISDSLNAPSGAQCFPTAPERPHT